MHACDNVRQTRELTYVTGHVNTRSHLWKFTTWRFICRGLTVCFLLMSLWLAMVLLSSSGTPWAWLQVRLRSVPRVSPFSTEQWTHIFSQQISKEQEDEWKHMMPFEHEAQDWHPSISVQVSLAKASFMAKPQTSEAHKYSPPTLLRSTTKSHGKMCWCVIPLWERRKNWQQWSILPTLL